MNILSKQVIFSIGFLFCLISVAMAQEETMMFSDHIYVSFIKSVKFHHRGLVTSMPIVDLYSSGILNLSFDDLEGGSKTYNYEIIYCDRNWNPSDLNTTEYLDGFNGEDIEKQSRKS